MTQSQGHFDEFGGHTLLKHHILRAYLFAWAFKLLQSPRGSIVHFVDAFAGAGKDGAGNPGSPLIAARIAAEVRAKLREHSRTAGRTMRVIAIEKLPSRCQALREHLAPFDGVDAQLVRVYGGELVDHIDEIVGTVRGEPLLTFLDPFGIKGLDASTYAKALSGDRDEIFALFADLGAGRLHGVVMADPGRPDIHAQIEALRGQTTLFPEWHSEAEEALTAEAEEYRRALDISQPASREYLTRALGGDHWETALNGALPEDRPAIFLGLFVQALVRAGARYVVPLPMRNERGIHVYTLVHASKSAKGFVAMKAAISEGLRKGLLPSDVCQQIHEDLAVPVPALVDELARGYAARTVRWTDVVKPRVLETTAIFPFQLDELKRELAARGYLSKKIPIEYSFPPLTPV